MHWRVLGLAALAAWMTTPLAAQKTAKRPSTVQAAKPTGPVAVIDTTMGRIVCRLYEAQAPELTANFVALAEGAAEWKNPATGQVEHGKPFYDGTAIFGLTAAISAGDRMGGGKGVAGEPLEVKKPALKFDQPGRLAMSIREGKISRSMFFITDHANAEMDEGNRGAIFGQCEEGTAATVTAIAHLLVATDNHPAKPVAINRISIVAADAPLPAVAPNVDLATVVPQPTPVAASFIPAPEPTGRTALIDTTMGQLTCRLFEKEAPIATGVFIGLAEGTKDWTMPHTKRVMHGRRFYDGLLFNRVLPDFMIQNQNYPGGSTGGGEIGLAYDVETAPGLSFDRPGRLAMANAGPKTNDSSFFITEQPRSALDNKFTIFGQCDEASVKVVSAIARVPRDAHNRPLTPVVIRKITVAK